MRTTTLQAAIGSALLLLAAHPCHASPQHLQHRHQHQHQHRQIHQHHRNNNNKRDNFTPSNDTVNPRYDARRSDKLQARDGAKCEFPSTEGLVAVTPDAMNGGWALSPDKECVDGTWCPIACPPGQLMAQWKPDTVYTFPESTYGGIYCDGGEISVPFEGKAWCVDGTGAVDAVNNAGDVVSFCQTVLPGYEDMIIPTDVQGTVTLAVPGPSYWDSTASHFYVNAPGISSAEGCVWGDDSKPIGNWAPYVAGANTDGSGDTFVKLGINPVWQSSALYSDKPTFGLKIECDGDCNGLPCEIDGSGVVSNEEATGAGGADFCVVTVSNGGKANIVIFNLDGSGGDGGDSGGETSSSSSEPTSTPSSTPSSTPTPTPTATSTPTSTSTSISSTTSSSSSASTTSSDEPITTSSASITSASSYPISPSSSTSSKIPFLGGVFHQNGTSSDANDLGDDPTAPPEPDVDSTSGSESEDEGGNENQSGSQNGGQNGGQSESPAQSQNQGQSEPSSTKQNHTENAGRRQDEAAIAGFIVAFVAAVYLL
ncbi:beta-glucosidase-domain-containing protein [Xylaria intraflava]|nr:beta-glucosidase-domain-containing protein [Xylaria intraflava]